MRRIVESRYSADPCWRETAWLTSKTRRHRKRVAEAISVLDSLAAACARPVVATSWGKDSVVLCDLAIRAGITDAITMDSHAELPGGEDVESYFEARMTVHRVARHEDVEAYIEHVREVGLCFEREDNTKASRAKGDLAYKWIRNHGFDGQAMGLRAEESRHRRINAAYRGLGYQKVDGLWVTIPISWWTGYDVWAYIVSRDLPYHPLYDCESHGYNRYTLRNTGWLTTVDIGAGRIPWLRRHFPDQYRALVREFPRVAIHQ